MLAQLRNIFQVASLNLLLKHGLYQNLDGRVDQLKVLLMGPFLSNILKNMKRKTPLKNLSEIWLVQHQDEWVFLANRTEVRTRYHFLNGIRVSMVLVKGLECLFALLKAYPPACRKYFYFYKVLRKPNNRTVENCWGSISIRQEDRRYGATLLDNYRSGLMP